MQALTLSQEQLAADKLLQAYAYQKAAKQAAQDEMRAIEALLEQLAGRHPEWFDSQATHTLPHGRLCYTRRTELMLAHSYDAHAFYTAFPHLLRLQPSVSALKVAMAQPAVAGAVERLGISLHTLPQFEIKL